MADQLNDFKKEASSYTQKANRRVAEKLKINLQTGTNQEYEVAKKHCILAADELEIKDQTGRIIWSVKAFNFLKKAEIPDSVNPSLWIHGKTDQYAGIFEVVATKIYQVRGFDISNLTLIRSKTGWIVLDVLSNVETANAALEFAEKALNENIRDHIKAIIISHSHADHFGGIRGIIREERVGQLQNGQIPIYAPVGFQIEAVKENVFAGTAMKRRAAFQFGNHQNCGEKGTIDSGLGLAIPSGTVSFIAPTNYITEDQTLVIDGLTIEFQLTPGTEAPAEMNNYFPEYRALWVAENCSGTLHNLYPIRGAKVRDATGWAHYLLETIKRFGKEAEVVFQGHQWPHFKTVEHPNTIHDYLLNNAAVYQYIHDQTLLYANQGDTPKEIARKIHVPDELLNNWYVRPYYGSVEINARAVYNKYLGYYNGNPINLFPLTEVEAAKKFVAYVGSEQLVLEKVKVDLENGNYQWAAFASNQVIFADPQNKAARQLCADALEQLGYQSEPSIWRNAYLQGAKELREQAELKPKSIDYSNDLLKQMTPKMLLQYLGIVIDSSKAAEANFKFGLKVIDKSKEEPATFLIHLYYGTLLITNSETDTLPKYAKLSKEDLFRLLTQQPLRDDLDTNCLVLLQKLQSYIVDLSTFKQFHILEP
ncbi:alkyl/aryl-sulfatase [Lentilactobacillus hilgardii]|uniref:alkyl/aryl-sulfatase n=1 Tax=Lentilactobacillus hilgardii TaxID=1588 RepID=UPI003FA5C47A